MVGPVFKVDSKKFGRLIDTHAALFKKTRDETILSQGRLLGRELIQRTPPLSGKTIQKMLKARGRKMKAPEGELLKDRKIGEMAVARDVRQNERGKARWKKRRHEQRLTEREIKAVIKKKQASVGKAKAGWVPGFVRSGGKRPGKGGWIGRHGNTQGKATAPKHRNRLMLTFHNRSGWATLSETTRIIKASVARRERAMRNQIARALEKSFGKGAGGAFR